MSEDVLIFVNNEIGNDTNAGTSSAPLATADEAFRRLPPVWHRRAEITFANTRRDYRMSSDAVYFGTPIGPDASPLVIRGGYEDLFVVRATSGSTGDQIITTIDVPDDELIGAVITRLAGAGSAIGTAISIRGNGRGANSFIALQRSIGAVVRGETFKVQRPAVNLVPTESLNLTSHDGRSLNCTLIGIRVAPVAGAGLALLNLRVQCDTCEFSFRSANAFVHTRARVQGGIENESLSPGLSCQRGQAGVYINSDDPSNFIWAVRDGVLGAHLTFKKIAVRVSQGGAFVPKSLEALESPIRIMAGGSAIAEGGGWGTLTNKARIRNVTGADGDGLRASNGGSINSPLSPIHLDVSRCSRDGIRLDTASSACFGPPTRIDPATGRETEGETGLVSVEKNGSFGMNVRNGSRALVGLDAHTATVPPATSPMTLRGVGGEIALDDVALSGWTAVSLVAPAANARLSLVRRYA